MQDGVALAVFFIQQIFPFELPKMVHQKSKRFKLIVLNCKVKSSLSSSRRTCNRIHTNQNQLFYNISSALDHPGVKGDHSLSSLELAKITIYFQNLFHDLYTPISRSNVKWRKTKVSILTNYKVRSPESFWPKVNKFKLDKKLIDKSIR